MSRAELLLNPQSIQWSMASACEAGMCKQHIFKAASELLDQVSGCDYSRLAGYVLQLKAAAVPRPILACWSALYH